MGVWCVLDVWEKIVRKDLEIYKQKKRKKKMNYNRRIQTVLEVWKIRVRKDLEIYIHKNLIGEL